MTDHKFSNQKSALEDYFQSLLSDEPESNSSDQKNSAEAFVAAVPAQIIDADETNVSPAVETTSVVEPGVTDAKPIVPRPSVADMLAKVETVTEQNDAAIDVDFAEPVVDIKMPIPELQEHTETVTETVTRVELETEVEAEVALEIEEKVEAEIAVTADLEQQAATPVVRKSEPPDWAESAFQCLLFQVGGLSLAVPLITLNGVIPWSENVVETPNQTDWYLGVLMNHGNKVQVIDTAVMVLPEEHRKDMAADPADRLSHILLVDDQRWGLACESIGDVVWLNKEDVKWRSNTTKRPWLLGTAVEHMCAVMETSAFADMLEGEK